MTDFTLVSLGKKEYEPDVRTLKLGQMMKLPEIHVPSHYDFDDRRREFPMEEWGNLDWGNCVICGQANQLLRFERIEQRRTLKLREEDVVGRYKALSGAEKPGDGKDQGLIVLEAMKDWQNSGFVVVPVPKGKAKATPKNFKIAAYGELDPDNHAQMRGAIYLLHGIHMGFWLPRAAQKMSAEKFWNYKGETGPDWEPGSWGGHLVYCKAYDEVSYEVISWGGKIIVTNSFVDRYCDEAWAAVDNLNSPRTRQVFDVDALVAKLHEIGAQVNL
jgi:hypothetical protein